MEKENLLPLISEIECLRAELSLGSSFSSLAPWSDQVPRDADEGALWRLYERLCLVWEGRGYGC